jgi:lysophospholipid acyltransferase 1/2
MHIIAQSTLCYALLMYTPKHKSHILVFIAGMGYACIAHMYRQYYDYGGYTLDVTRYILKLFTESKNMFHTLFLCRIRLIRSVT